VSPGAQPGLSEQALEPNQASQRGGTTVRARTLVRSEGSRAHAASGQAAAAGGDHFIGALSTTTTPTPVTTATLCPAAVAVARGNPARHWRCVRRPLPLLLLLVCGCEAAAVRRL
jgi:hypothetical protein